MIVGAIVVIGCVILLGAIFFIPKPDNTENVERSLAEEEDEEND